MQCVATTDSHRQKIELVHRIVLYLQPVLNPKSYDGARVLEASGRPMNSFIDNLSRQQTHNIFSQTAVCSKMGELEEVGMERAGWAVPHKAIPTWG